MITEHVFTHANGKRYRWTDTGALEFLDTPPAYPRAIDRAERLPVPDLKRRKRWFGKGRHTQGSIQ